MWATLGALFALATTQSDFLEIEGVFRDGRTGQTVSGVDVGSVWIAGPPSGLTVISDDRLVSDRFGKFRVRLGTNNNLNWLLAFDAGRQTGALIDLSTRDKNTLANLVLHPLVHVRGSVISAKHKASIFGMGGFVRSPDGRQSLFSWSTNPTSGRFSFDLPPGSYQLVARGKGMNSAIRDMVIKDTGPPELDLGEIALDPDKSSIPTDAVPPPLTIAPLAGHPTGFQLSDLDGQWVLVQFLNLDARIGDDFFTRCLQRLADYRTNSSWFAKHVSVVLIVNKTSGPWEAWDQFLSKAFDDSMRKEIGHFVVVFDASGKTTKAWGMSKRPIGSVLLDPDGLVVDCEGQSPLAVLRKQERSKKIRKELRDQ